METNLKTLDISSVSEEQLRIMKHALGMNYKKKPYRNYFYCSKNNSNWNDLVSKGFATMSGGWNDEKAYYSLTFEAVKLVYGKRMSKKYYDEL